MKDHRLIDERSLAMHRLIAAKLRANPALAEQARANIARWLETCPRSARAALLEWQRLLLAAPGEELLAVLEGADERAARLRQSSPFAGALSAEERNAILLQFHRRESRAA